MSSKLSVTAKCGLGALISIGAALPGFAQGGSTEEPTTQQLAERVLELELLLGDHLSEEEVSGQGLGFHHNDVRASFQIFGDVGASAEKAKVMPDANSAFGFGSLSFVINAELGENFRAFSETAIDGKSNDVISFSQERLWVSWNFSNELYAKVGTEHSPLLRWNQLYHHGEWLQPTIDRPLLAAYEGDGGLVPLHRTGLTLGGSSNSAAMRVEYFATVSNGRGETATDKQRTDDANDQKAIDVGFAVEPHGVPGLRAGVSIVSDKIPADPNAAAGNPLRASSMDESIVAGSLEYELGPVLLSGELAYIEHQALANGQKFTSNAGYLQCLYPVEEWTPYLRFDYRHMARNDPFYTELNRDLDRWVQSLGLRWDYNANVAVKVEVGFGRGHQRSAAGSVSEADILEGSIQLAWWL